MKVYNKNYEAELQSIFPKKRVNLLEVIWWEENPPIYLTLSPFPLEIDVNYKGKEPEYISNLRKFLEDKKIRLQININKDFSVKYKY